MEKIRVLYIVSGTHFYGDNRSLLEILIDLKKYIFIHVLIGGDIKNDCRKSLFLEKLDEYNIEYTLTKSVYSVPRLKVGQSITLRYLKWWMVFLKNSLLSAPKFCKVIRIFRPNIIHSNNGLVYGGWLFSFLCRKTHIWHLREYIDKDHQMQHWPSKNFFINQISKGCAIANSKGVFDYFRLNSSNSAVIYNPVGVQYSYEPRKKDYILFVGRLIPTKGVKELLSIFKRVRQEYPHLRLLIAGGIEKNNPYISELLTIADEPSYENSVSFLGYCSDVNELMKQAVCLVVPSYYEAFGRITVEALFNGCLVVGRNSGGTREIIELCKSGFLFDTDEECIEKIKKIIQMNADEYEMVVSESQRLAENYFKREQVAIKVLDFYRAIVN